MRRDRDRPTNRGCIGPFDLRNVPPARLLKPSPPSLPEAQGAGKFRPPPRRIGASFHSATRRGVRRGHSRGTARLLLEVLRPGRPQVPSLSHPPGPMPPIACAKHAEEQHRQDEPGRRLAHRLLGDAAGIVGGGGEIVQHDRRGPPEGDEGEHRRGRHHHSRELRRRYVSLGRQGPEGG